MAKHGRRKLLVSLALACGACKGGTFGKADAAAGSAAQGSADARRGDVEATTPQSETAPDPKAVGSSAEAHDDPTGGSRGNDRDAAAAPGRHRGGRGAEVAPPLVVGQPVPDLGLDAKLESCPSCALNGSAHLLILGDLQAQGLTTDLEDLGAVAQFYGDNDLKALAVLARLGPGEASSAARAIAELGERGRLGLSILVDAPPSPSLAQLLGPAPVGPIVVLVDAGGRIEFIARTRDDWPALDAAIATLLELNGGGAVAGAGGSTAAKPAAP